MWVITFLGHLVQFLPTERTPAAPPSSMKGLFKWKPMFGFASVTFSSGFLSEAINPARSPWIILIKQSHIRPTSQALCYKLNREIQKSGGKTSWCVSLPTATLQSGCPPAPTHMCHWINVCMRWRQNSVTLNLQIPHYVYFIPNQDMGFIFYKHAVVNSSLKFALCYILDFCSIIKLVVEETFQHVFFPAAFSFTQKTHAFPRSHINMEKSKHAWSQAPSRMSLKAAVWQMVHRICHGHSGTNMTRTWQLLSVFLTDGQTPQRTWEKMSWNQLLLDTCIKMKIRCCTIQKSPL